MTWLVADAIVNGSVGDGASMATRMVTDAIPLVLGVAGAWLAFKMVMYVMGEIGGPVRNPYAGHDPDNPDCFCDACGWKDEIY